MSALQGATDRTLPFPQDGRDIKTSATATIKRANGTLKPVHKPLDTRFRYRGFDYRQRAREGDVAIFEQTWPHCPEPSGCYEVVRIRRHDGLSLHGKFFEPAEFYPRSSEWGVWAWTYADKDKAFAKLREVIASPNALTRFEQQEGER